MLRLPPEPNRRTQALSARCDRRSSRLVDLGGWRGLVALTYLRLGDATVQVEAEGQAAKVRGLHWQLITPQE